MTAPGFWSIARRPRWIAALALALGIAASFAALGQWQLDRSLASGAVDERDTETAVPLSDLAMPQSVMTSEASGRVVTVDGTWVPGDDIVVTGRVSGDDGSGTVGEPGDWVVRHFVAENGASLVVAVGYGQPGASIPPLPAGNASLTGRYVPSESPQAGDFEAGERSSIAIAELINLWADVDEVYSGYLVLDAPPDGLSTIAAPPPQLDAEVNLLNLFYAIEWALFGGFAIYLWWRLVKDEQEKFEQAAAGETAGDPQPAPLN